MSYLSFVSYGSPTKPRVYSKLCQQCSMGESRRAFHVLSSERVFIGRGFLKTPRRQLPRDLSTRRLIVSSLSDPSFYTAFQNILPVDPTFLLSNRLVSQFQTLVAEATDKATSASTEIAKNPGLFDSFVNIIQTAVTMFHNYLEGWFFSSFMLL